MSYVHACTVQHVHTMLHDLTNDAACITTDAVCTTTDAACQLSGCVTY